MNNDFILRGDVAQGQDHLSKRQSAKINYLQQEVRQLQDYIQDLETMLKLNKEALMLSYNTPATKDASSTQTSSSITKSQSQQQSLQNISNLTTASVREEYAQLQAQKQSDKELIQNILQENKQLKDSMNKLILERNIAQSQALINCQISEQAQMHEYDVTLELEEKITELRRIIQDKEFTVQQLEKQKPIIENSGTLIKIKEPSEIAIKFQEQTDQLRSQVTKQNARIQEQSDQNQILMLDNYNLKKELFKIKLSLQNPVNIQRIKSYLHTQNEDISMDENSIFLREYYNFNNLNSDDNTNNNNQSSAQQQQSQQITLVKDETDFVSFRKKIEVPKLDLTKALVISNIACSNNNASPQKQSSTKMQQEKHSQNLQKVVDKKQPLLVVANSSTDCGKEQINQLLQKCDNLYEELKKTQKLFQREVLNNRILLADLKGLEDYSIKIQETNEVLIESNQQFLKQNQDLIRASEFYRQYFTKYNMIIKHRNIFNRRFSISNLLQAEQQQQQQESPLQLKRNDQLLQKMISNWKDVHGYGNQKQEKAKKALKNQHSEKEDEHEVNISILPEQEQENDITIPHFHMSQIQSIQQDLNNDKIGNNQLLMNDIIFYHPTDNGIRGQTIQLEFEGKESKSAYKQYWQQMQTGLQNHLLKHIPLGITKSKLNDLASKDNLLFQNQQFKQQQQSQQTQQQLQVKRYQFRNYLILKRQNSDPLDYISVEGRKSLSEQPLPIQSNKSKKRQFFIQIQNAAENHMQASQTSLEMLQPNNKSPLEFKQFLQQQDKQLTPIPNNQKVIRAHGTNPQELDEATELQQAQQSQKQQKGFFFNPIDNNNANNAARKVFPDLLKKHQAVLSGPTNAQRGLELTKGLPRNRNDANANVVAQFGGRQGIQSGMKKRINSYAPFNTELSQILQNANNQTTEKKPGEESYTNELQF